MTSRENAKISEIAAMFWADCTERTANLHILGLSGEDNRLPILLYLLNVRRKISDFMFLSLKKFG
jgi:hypothetical protein